MSDVTPPITFVWEGDCFRPGGPYWARQADKHYVIGVPYDLVPHQERSHKSHAHYFASVNEAWKNLPEDISERFPTADHLRKYALIKGGFCHTQTVVFANRKDAEKAAAIIAPLDEFSIVDVYDTTLTRYAAKSQNHRSMDKAEFQKSKDSVLDIIAAMISTPVESLKSNADKAA